MYEQKYPEVDDVVMVQVSGAHEPRVCDGAWHSSCCHLQQLVHSHYSQHVGCQAPQDDATARAAAAKRTAASSTGARAGSDARPQQAAQCVCSTQLLPPCIDCVAGQVYCRDGRLRVAAGVQRH